MDNLVTTADAKIGVLSGTGVTCSGMVYPNLAAARLIEMALHRGEGRLSADGALVVNTGVHTGRSVQDKFIVDESSVHDQVWWGTVNRPLSTPAFAGISATVKGYLHGRDLFVQDLLAGADPRHQVRVRLVTTNAWHALFARNMFIRPGAAEMLSFEPDYVILHAPDLMLDADAHGIRTGTVVALSFEQKLVVIAGTEYAGEIKKSVFTIMNWLLPTRGVLPMHCAANRDQAGRTALFFGLSGTGKTTLSSEPSRPLIGDDEHGWSDAGVFNFEGGCYAKVINLQQSAEPEIWQASHRFGAVLENVAIDEQGNLDLADATATENTRSCYPIPFVANADLAGQAGEPLTLIMLTADAFGVLPPIARLDVEQAMYHFLSGYTARVAGTEKGLGKEPQATFSTCFGAPFLPRPPQVYGDLLRRRLEAGTASCWLLNTGWTGGAYGTGRRMSIAHTRQILRMALDGALDGVACRVDAYFGLSVPEHVPGVPDDILNPQSAWSDREAYAQQARQLVARFRTNAASFSISGQLPIGSIGSRSTGV